MFEEQEQTAQTSEETVGQVTTTAEQAAPAESGKDEAESTNEAEFKDGNDQPAKEPQSKERNAEEARKRREAERQQELKKARTDAVLEATGGVNPYTGEEMKDADDVEEYLTMKRIEKDGKDPVKDFAGYAKQRERDRRAQEAAREQQEAQVREDIAAFKKAHPDVDTKELLNDEAFSDYADGKIGHKPLTEIYDGYQKLIGKTRQTEQEKAAQALANSKASPGSVQNNSTGETDFFTAEQVRKMTAAEVEKNYEKIMKSMAKW